MPARKPLTVDLATNLHAFYERMPIEEIVKAIRDGKEVELVESIFTDPNDYCAVNIEGRQVFYEEGY